MALIPTGFSIRPFVGAVDSDQLLARYMPMERFMQMAERKSLWLTRIHVWKDNDACEASLLPAYRQHLRTSLADEGEFLHMKALMEFTLRASFGCCFSIFDGSENDLMWRSYTRDPQYGVIVVMRAQAVQDAISDTASRRKYLAKVKYLADKQAERMRLSDCAHSRIKRHLPEWDVSECSFFKRVAFSGEREVRCVISADESWTGMFNEFLVDEKIPQFAGWMPTPKDQPYVRVDKRDSMTLSLPTDRAVFITIPQMRQLTKRIEDECIPYLERNTSPATAKGMFIPFDLRQAERVILHPRFTTANAKEKNMLIRKIRDAGLSCQIDESQLYASGW
jgi:hypothetical protein